MNDDVSPRHEDSLPLTPNLPVVKLLQKLTASSAECQRFLLGDPCFWRPDLLDLLLARCRESLPADPEQALRLAMLAIRLARKATQALPDTAPSALVIAQCLCADAHRLALRPNEAERYLSCAASVLSFDPLRDLGERATYCRSRALLRWDCGHLDDALALLRRARALFNPRTQFLDYVTTALLEGLLLDELGAAGELVDTLSPLIGDPIVRACPSWLISRAFLSFAATAASRVPYASSALAEGLQALARIADPDEQLRLFRLEARARARLGSPDDGEQMLEAVRRRHFESRQVLDLALSTLDLLALRVDHDRHPAVDELYKALMSLGLEDPAVVTSGCAIDRFVSLVAGEEEPWQASRLASLWLLQSLRFARIGPPPLPFA